MVLVISMLLVVLFPGQNLINALSRQQYISDVDFRYSVLLLDEDIELNAEQIKKNPEQVLSKLILSTNEQDASKNWLKYIILKTIAYQPDLNERTKAVAFARLKNYLITFKGQALTAEQNTHLAEDALAIDQAPLALFFYEQAVKTNPNQSVYFYAKAGQTAMWAKQCVKSATYYFTAQKLTESIQDKRYFFILALKTLFQCNEYDLAIQLAEKHLGTLSQDTQTYQLLTELALKANQTEKAQFFVLKLLELKEKNRAAEEKK